MDGTVFSAAIIAAVIVGAVVLYLLLARGGVNKRFHRDPHARDNDQDHLGGGFL